jgi:D-amino-acid dehydrogenase
MTHSQVTIVGAGIVGACIARSLEKEGHDVVLVDRNDPGSGCSFGNSGAILSLGASTQLPGPRLLAQIPGMLLDRNAPLVLRWRHLPGLMPWLAAFVAGCRESRQVETAHAMATLLSDTTGAYDRLLKDSSADALIRRNGALGLSRTDDWFAGDSWRRELNASLGARMEEVSREDLDQLEPSLSASVVRAMYYPDAYSTLDPARLTQQIVRDALAKGSRFVQAEVRDIRIENGKPTVLATDKGEMKIDRLIVAAGAYSHQVARKMGIRVLLNTERGYHVDLEGTATGLQRVLLHGEHALAINPRPNGLRIAGTVEFASLDASPDYRRAQALWNKGREVLKETCENDPPHMSFWMGRRPTLPDYRPVIGPAPGLKNCWFAFGHQHLGMSLAARTGEILADLVAARDPGVNLAPFRADRF